MNTLGVLVLLNTSTQYVLYHLSMVNSISIIRLIIRLLKNVVKQVVTRRREYNSRIIE